MRLYGDDMSVVCIRPPKNQDEWLNTYSVAINGSNMGDILCPHCEEDIELEEGEYGLFECPYCDEEFSWSNQKKWSLKNILKWTNIVAVVIFVIGLVLFLMMLEYFRINPPSGYGGLIIVGPIGMMITGVTVSYLSLLIWILGKKIRKEIVHKGLFYSAIAPLVIFLMIMFPIRIMLS
ncbi:MAG TPA: hypothetical protein EYQ73_07970 [Candidatus Poseidoniales archaeon]|nr:hypothetical protein [Candidatus Poseidoniales archaeon]